MSNERKIRDLSPEELRAVQENQAPKPAHDLEALIHAQNCILARNAIFPHVLDRRALAELDRLIAEAKVAT